MSNLVRKVAAFFECLYYDDHLPGITCCHDNPQRQILLLLSAHCIEKKTEAQRGYNPCLCPQRQEVRGLGLELRPVGSVPKGCATKSRSFTGFYYLEGKRHLCKPFTELEATSLPPEPSLSFVYLFVFDHHLHKSHKNWKLPQLHQ